MHKRRRSFVVALLLASYTPFLLACRGDDLTAPLDDKPICKAPGTTHHSPLAGDEIWAKEAGPHHVTGAFTDDVAVRATLIIEAGTTVCFAPGASLTLQRGTLIAHGTKDQPILFTAADSSDLWGGLTIAPTGARADIGHVIVENATAGIVANGPVYIQNARIRRIWGPGITFSYYNLGTYIRNTVIDSAGLDGTRAVYMEAGTLENSRIVNSGGDGLVIYARYGLPRAFTCEVTGSRDHGIHVLLRSTGVAQIHDCNLHNNGGMGINNDADTSVNAQRNWWGDPAGPLGPSGDGVSGMVDYSSARTQPVTGIGS